MDSYQGSTPLNLIPFRLETPSKENTSAPTLPQVSSPVNAEDSTTLIEGHKRGEVDTSEPQPEAKHGGSAGSQDSDTICLISKPRTDLRHPGIDAHYTRRA